MSFQYTTAAIACATDIFKYVLIRRIFVFSHMPEIIAKLYAPFAALFISQLVFFCKKNKQIRFNDFIFGFFAAQAYDTYFDMAYGFSVSTTFPLQAAVEVLAIVVALFVTEAIVGRKARLERNTVVICTALAALAYFCIPKTFNTKHLIAASLTNFFLFSAVNIMKHICAASLDLTNIIMFASAFIVIISALKHNSMYLPELIKMNEDILENRTEAGALFAILVVNIFADLYAYGSLDIDIIFLYKLVVMAAMLVIEHTPGILEA